MQTIWIPRVRRNASCFDASYHLGKHILFQWNCMKQVTSLALLGLGIRELNIWTTYCSTWQIGVSMWPWEAYGPHGAIWVRSPLADWAFCCFFLYLFERHKACFARGFWSLMQSLGALWSRMEASGPSCTLMGTPSFYFCVEDDSNSSCGGLWRLLKPYGRPSFGSECGKPRD